MSARNALRQVFRHGPRERVSEDAFPLSLKRTSGTSAGVDSNNKCDAVVPENKRSKSLTTPLPKTPEPFGLADIVEEAHVGTPSTIETASLTETLTSLELDISTFSTRELVYATLDEAKSTADSHLDTISTMLALLEALDGFSATIAKLKNEIVEKKQACEGKVAMLEAVERAIEGMVFPGEQQEQNVRRD
ncbi:hypothetical protein C7974DRAFT_442134 [Boeremia exigua]|uniref:uncharacterized protein n=1 Tax=Boeremia exigua TaxID=749465 RepID=UPI001E8D3D7B|nr:uncharacterized protein C7974DRAFT_442134 [Boeremia exigua]KAH6616419.1 hypothetical protein C7974DRAFT_442134 [Boeremia exigua]